MRFLISINQVKVLEWGLNMNEAIVFSIIYDAKAWAKEIIIDGVSYHYISRNKICDEVPAMNLKPDRAYRHLRVLHEKGLIEWVKDFKKDCIRVTDKGNEWYYAESNGKNTDTSANKTSARHKSRKSSVNKTEELGKNAESNPVNIPTYKGTDVNKGTNDKGTIDKKDSPPLNNSNSPSKKEPVKDQKKQDPLPGAIFSQRLIDYLDEPGTPDFLWECFDELIDWSKKKDVYIDWETKEGFEKNQKASVNIFSRIRIATGKDETGEGMELEIKKFLKKIDQWWYNNGISLQTLDKNFEKIFNSKQNGKSKRDNKPEPGDYKAEAEKVERGEFHF